MMAASVIPKIVGKKCGESDNIALASWLTSTIVPLMHPSFLNSNFKDILEEARFKYCWLA
jgi:hypothetical protein